MELEQNRFEGLKNRLEEARKNSEKIVLKFQYPNLSRQTIRVGKVIGVFDDCFNFQDRYEGRMTFSYTFIIEITKPKEGM